MLKTVALFFMVVLAAPETYKDIIEKAYSLSLQKDRTQAVLLLSSSIKKETKKSPAPKDLFQALEQVSTIFFSEKAQQLYELGLSLKTSDLQVSLAKINESLKIEPDNYLSLVSQLQIMIAMNDCSSAVDQAKKLRDVNPFLESLQLVQAQAIVCQGKTALHVSKNPNEIKKSPLQLFWQTNELEVLVKSSALVKARELLAGLKKMDEKFPELDYWAWKINADTKAAQKYISTCKNLSAKQTRKYLPEPMLCRRTPEVEGFLKKSSSNES